MASIPFEELITVIFVISDDWYEQQGGRRKGFGRRIERGRVSKKETGEMILRSYKE
jgi:hypothetical protein